MARPSYSELRRLVVVAVCLVCAAAALTGSTAGSGTREPLLVLQMNLCNSGIARCYTGRSVAEAAAVIRANAPDVVTLNEVCRGDVYALDQTLMDVYPGGTVVWAFKAATDRRTAGAFRCRNGQPYGIGLLAHIRVPYRGHATYSGIYPTQDLRDPEERAWLCLYAIGSFYACTTHLANAVVALAQCGYLLDTAIPALRAKSGEYEPTVLAGDLNLRRGGSPDVRSCVPSDYLLRSDRDVQHIVATTDFIVSSVRSIDMDATTDHPGLLVELVTPRTSGGGCRGLLTNTGRTHCSRRRWARDRGSRGPTGQLRV